MGNAPKDQDVGHGLDQTEHGQDDPIHEPWYDGTQRSRAQRLVGSVRWVHVRRKNASIPRSRVSSSIPPWLVRLKRQRQRYATAGLPYEFGEPKDKHVGRGSWGGGGGVG